MTRMPSRGSIIAADRTAPEASLAGRARGRHLGYGARGSEVSLADHDVAVLRVIRELAPIAATLLEVEGHAGVDRPAVDVERDHGLAPLDDHLVDGLDLVHRVHGAPRVALLHFPPVDVELGGPGQAVEAGDVLIVGRVAPEVLVVDHGQMALLDGHPSELAVMG